MSQPPGNRYTRQVMLVLSLCALLLVASCTDSGTFSTPGSQGKSSTPLTPLNVAVEHLADGAKDVSTAAEFPIQTNGEVTSASLTDSQGKTVEGGFPRGDKTWVPNSQLSYGTEYQLNIRASQGRMSKTFTSRFTTRSKSGSLTGADLYVSDGQTVGVGMPIIVLLDASVPKERRADVERRLFVSTEPAQEGSWHWYSGTKVHYRPKEYWKAGTKVTVRLGIGGLELAKGKFGRADRKATFNIGSSVITKVDNATKTATVYQDGQVIRQMPVSLGKPSTPTSSGVHVAIEKFAEKIFDSESFGLAHENGGYRMKVYWDVRFTWGGEFVHAAPWSVGDQGKRNVSHGCMNVSPANAKWFYELSKKGDIIEIVGTEEKVKPGDGWTDWNLTWEQYKAGSALNS